MANIESVLQESRVFQPDPALVSPNNSSG